MSIHDLRHVEEGFEIEADLCIVGSGPAGMSLALQFETLPLRVCLLESGGIDRDPAIESLNEIESVGARRAPQDVTRCRGLGGTSALWTGRCGAFDHVDFQARPWVPDSGWPIGHEDVSSYFDKAGRLLGLGPAIYADQWPEVVGRAEDHKTWDARVFRPVVFQYSQAGAANAAPARDFVGTGVEGAEHIGALQHAGAPRAVHFGEAHASTLKASRTIGVWLHANATGVETDADGTQVCGVTLRTLEGKRARVKAPVVVLACGGVDNARLLLASRSASHPAGLGNGHDTVGRFLTDHPLAKVATYAGEGDPAFRRRYGHRWYDRAGNRHVYSLGVRLSPVVQREEGLLNCAVHLLEYGDRPATVSVAGRLARSLRARTFDDEARADARTLLRDPLGLATGVYDRYVRRQPALAPPTSIAFCCAVEQVLDPESRVMLSQEVDAAGLPRARIDWRISDDEYRTALRTTELLYGELSRLGYRLPDRAAWLHEGPEAFRAGVHDMAHPMSSTRMSDDPRRGVVDRDCKVHGVGGLYVAGSSVFSTPGYMNPTMMIVALSLRLADHLKERVARGLEASSDAAPASARVSAAPASPRRARIGFVGAGDRVRRIYLPILAALADRFEIVGVSGRSAEKTKAFAAETGLTAHDSAAELAATAKPDFLVAAVSPGSVDDALPGIVGLGVPVLMETPFCWNVLKGRRLAQIAERRGVLLGVAEQTPFLPREQLKRRVIELGLIGRIVAAENGFAVYDYHGVAALRAYGGAENAPVAANAVVAPMPTSRLDATRDPWTLGVVTLADGARLIHHYSDRYADSPARSPKALRVHGTSGSIDGDRMLFERPDDAPLEAWIEERIVDGVLEDLTVETPIGPIAWRNPFHGAGLHDPEQIAVATLLDGMTNAVFHKGAPAYGPDAPSSTWRS